MNKILAKIYLYSKKAYWSFKSVVGIRGKTDQEFFYRISRMSDNRKRPQVVQLSWGNLGFTTAGSLLSQFEEIYIKRHYACAFRSSNPVIIDCGGNIGLSAIWFRQNYPGCELTVYEADPELARLLTKNVQRAGYPDTKICNAAVWIDNTQLSFAVKGDDTGKIDVNGKCLVQAVDLATLLPSHVDLLKLDIEGAEFEVMERLLQTGALRQVRNLVIEFHPSRQTMERMLRILIGIADSGMKFNFEATLAPWLGVEDKNSPFEIVARNRTFLHLYAWQN